MSELLAHQPGNEQPDENDSEEEEIENSGFLPNRLNHTFFVPPADTVPPVSGVLMVFDATPPSSVRIV